MPEQPKTCRCRTESRLAGAEAKRYADTHLSEQEVRADGWEVVYVCPETGVEWLEDYPNNDEVANAQVRALYGHRIRKRGRAQSQAAYRLPSPKKPPATN